MQKDFSDTDFDEIKRRIRHESDRKIFQEVFDARTLKAVHGLASKGLFDVMEGIVSAGKEAHVFEARSLVGEPLAVKIFKKETTGFKRMGEYIEHDRRFKNLRRDRTNLVLAWTRKEYKNLLSAAGAGLSVPQPVGFRENVLVMGFVGEAGRAAPRLHDTKPLGRELKKYAGQTKDFLAGLYLAGLVHADLSEYNILVHRNRLVFIDFAQAVLLDHPKAGEFFRRDVQNMATYFTRKGLETGFDEFYNAVKDRKALLEKNMATQKKRRLK